MGVRGLRKKRIAGLGLLGVLLGLFIGFNRFPKLDIVREDLAAVSGPSAQCFQGFCINTGQSLLARWWEFSITYMELVTPGMIFAFLVAGLTASFLFPQGVRLSSSGGIWGSIKGLAVGTPLSLCSACIVPITRAMRGSGASISTTLGVVQGSATLNIPALLMVALIFTPLMGGSRILLSLIAGLLIGPVVARLVGGERDEVPPSGVPLALGDAEPVGWGEALWEATRDWMRASLGYLLRLGPIMVIAGFASGLALQWVRPDVVGDYLGNDVQGVAIAATLGILINVPLLFEIPLVVVLLLLGMGEAPAATLLFTAAAGGPITFWGLARALPRRAIVAFAGATWVVGLVGGIAIFALTPFVPDTALGFRSISETRHAGEEVLGTVVLPDVQHELQLTSFTVQQPPAGEGEVALAFTRLEPMQNGFHYEAWVVYETNVLSLGKFNVGHAGGLVDLQGGAIPEAGSLSERTRQARRTSSSPSSRRATRTACPRTPAISRAASRTARRSSPSATPWPWATPTGAPRPTTSSPPPAATTKGRSGRAASGGWTSPRTRRWRATPASTCRSSRRAGSTRGGWRSRGLPSPLAASTTSTATTSTRPTTGPGPCRPYRARTTSAIHPGASASPRTSGVIPSTSPSSPTPTTRGTRSP